jgi:predicted TIM-barrel fold metal-dependent hydrolase
MRTRRWVRKWRRDVEADEFSPLPTQVVSNEEYVPLAQTREQQRLAVLIDETARAHARRLGIGRRDFLASSAGMASAFLALNAVFGRFFDVDPVEALEPAAADARKPPDQFVFDVQTHHVAAPRQFPQLLGLRRLGRPWNTALERRLGIKNICLHKGLPLQGGVEEYWHPRDLERAARDFPDLRFIVYHSAFHSLGPALALARDEFRTSARVNWVTDLCEIRERNPNLTNIYAELGATFGQLVITSPMLCGHVLGMLIQSFGADHVLWGTDSIWWGAPQWQIEALRRFTMPEPLMKRFGYHPLTASVKAQILGLNAARLYGIDPSLHRNPVPQDYVSKLKAACLDEGARPSLTQYGWVLEESS